jgi:hypothetical protein
LQTLINDLRTAYAKIDTIDPSTAAYGKLVDLLDALTVDQLKTVVAADIKFVSKLANNRVFRRTGKFA